MWTSKIEPLLPLVNMDSTTNTSTAKVQKSKLSFVGIFVNNFFFQDQRKVIHKLMSVKGGEWILQLSVAAVLLR